MFRSWIRKVVAALVPTTSRQRSRARTIYRPKADVLENRVVPSGTELFPGPGEGTFWSIDASAGSEVSPGGEYYILPETESLTPIGIGYEDEEPTVVIPPDGGSGTTDPGTGTGEDDTIIVPIEDAPPEEDPLVVPVDNAPGDGDPLVVPVDNAPVNGSSATGVSAPAGEDVTLIGGDGEDATGTTPVIDGSSAEGSTVVGEDVTLIGGGGSDATTGTPAVIDGGDGEGTAAVGEDVTLIGGNAGDATAILTPGAGGEQSVPEENPAAAAVVSGADPVLIGGEGEDVTVGAEGEALLVGGASDVPELAEAVPADEHAGWTDPSQADPGVEYVDAEASEVLAADEFDPYLFWW